MEAVQTPVRQFRIEHLKLSQRQLARALKVPESKVCRIEQDGQRIDIDFIRKVAALCPDSKARDAFVRVVLGEAA